MDVAPSGVCVFCSVRKPTSPAGRSLRRLPGRGAFSSGIMMVAPNSMPAILPRTAQRSTMSRLVAWATGYALP